MLDMMKSVHCFNSMSNIPVMRNKYIIKWVKYLAFSADLYASNLIVYSSAARSHVWLSIY